MKELLHVYGSPLWLADVDRFRANLHAFTAAWQHEWPRTAVAYSYKTNRLPAFLEAADEAGAGAEVAGEAEYLLAAVMVEADPARIVVDGPAKPDSLLRRAAASGALVLADSVAELERIAAADGRRVGLRVALDSFTGAATRFGIAASAVAEAAARARALGLSVEALSTHLVSTDFAPDGRVVVSWPRPPGEHARAATLLGSLARTLGVGAVDLGGGFPAAPAVSAHAAAVSCALRASGFDGTLLIEPGRGIVADAVELLFTVVAVKQLPDGTRCLVCDAGTNLLPGALTAPIDVVAEGVDGPLSPALVTGPLCLNVDVLAPSVLLPALAPGAVLRARDVGAYQQAASTQFGEPRPAVVIRDEGEWTLHRGAETLNEILDSTTERGAR